MVIYKRKKIWLTSGFLARAVHTGRHWSNYLPYLKENNFEPKILSFKTDVSKLWPGDQHSFTRWLSVYGLWLLLSYSGRAE